MEKPDGISVPLRQGHGQKFTPFWFDGYDVSGPSSDINFEAMVGMRQGGFTVEVQHGCCFVWVTLAARFRFTKGMGHPLCATVAHRLG